MWWYWVLAVIAVLIASGFIYYRRVADRIKAKPLKDIPCPPLSHPLLGHPDKMTHPLRHELRLQVCNAAGGGIHQLVMMKYISIFINDCKEAARALIAFPEKGILYTSFRFDAKIPDLFTSDNEDWKIRHKAFVPALTSSFASAIISTKDLLEFLDKKAESGEPVDMFRLFTLLALDITCEQLFKYKLGAVGGSSEGFRLAESLNTLKVAQEAQGYYPKPMARKLSDDELKEAKATWRLFVEKLMGVQRSAAEQYRAKHNSLDPAHVLGHALLDLSERDAGFTKAHVFAEVHQLLRHSHECIAGQLSWVFVALHRNLKVHYATDHSRSSHLLHCHVSRNHI